MNLAQVKPVTNRMNRYGLFDLQEIPLTEVSVFIQALKSFDQCGKFSLFFLVRAEAKPESNSKTPDEFCSISNRRRDIYQFQYQNSRQYFNIYFQSFAESFIKTYQQSQKIAIFSSKKLT
jgi:hypothetical protein